MITVHPRVSSASGQEDREAVVGASALAHRHRLPASATQRRAPSPPAHPARRVVARALRAYAGRHGECPRCIGKHSPEQGKIARRALMFGMLDTPQQIVMRIRKRCMTRSQTQQPFDRTLIGRSRGIDFPAGPGFWKIHHDSHDPREICAMRAAPVSAPRLQNKDREFTGLYL